MSVNNKGRSSNRVLHLKYLIFVYRYVTSHRLFPMIQRGSSATIRLEKFFRLVEMHESPSAAQDEKQQNGVCT